MTVNERPNANPSATLSVSDSTPKRGETITITGNYTDADGNLSSATIRDLGSGNKTGNTGTFPSIGTAGESISGSRDSITRSFTIPTSVNTGSYTFRTEVVDADSASAIAWTTVNAQNNNPTVSLTVSATEITEGEMVTLTAVVDDSDGTVKRVSFIRGKVFQSYLDPTTSSVTHTYTPVGTGQRTFYAQVFDNDGAVANSNNVTFNVIAAPLPTPNVSPTVSISASDTAINEGESVTVTAIASDSDGTIESVEFRRNGSTVKTDTSSPYTYTYSSASAGTHRFEATAVDDDGDDTISNTVTVEVNDNPTVSLSVSATEITEGEMVTLTATATDSDGTVERVSFIRGKVFVHDTEAPFEHTYTPVGTGQRTFYAQVFDNDGAVANSNNVTFNVIAAPLPTPNVSPTVSISASDTAINEGESVTVTAIASDSDGTIESVTFRRNGSTVKTDTSSPYTYTYSSASAGTHRFEATAVDDDGDDTISNTVTVAVNANPTVSLSVSATEITLGESVTLTATATDSDGTVERVSFIRGKLLAIDNEKPFTYTYTPQGTGQRTFHAMAFDNDGGTATSNDVTFTVNPATDPPPDPPSNVAPVAMLSFSDSAPKRGETITITGNYTDSNGNLATATIHDLGTGDNTGNTGTFPSIGVAAESISGGSASIERDFTFPVTTALGTYTFRTEVVDAASASDAAGETVTVTNNNPTVSLSVSATEITEGQSVTLKATVDDSDGMVVRVSFIRGKVFVHDTEAPFEHTYTPVGTGQRTFYAQAFDDDGGVANSDNVTFTVIAATPVDGVSLSSSASIIALGSEVPLTAEVSQRGRSVERVKFYRDGSLVNTATASPYSYEDTPPAVGIYSYYARAEFSDQSHSDSMPIDVKVVEFLKWEDIDNNGILDQVLATLRKPTLSLGGVGSVVGENDIVLTVTDQSTYLLGALTPDYIKTYLPNYEIDVYLLASVRFAPQDGYTYRAQYKLGNVWYNWSPILTIADAIRGYILWCNYEVSWSSIAYVPATFRVVKLGRTSYAKGEPFSVDVNGDGVDDKVQKVSPEVYGQDFDELFIKADCPQGVIGCDQANTELVIKDNGRWIIVDQNQSIARVISPGDPDYPSSGVTPNDRVIAVKKSKARYLTIWFAEVTPVALTVKWIKKDSDLTINPNAGGGWRIYPGKQTPTDTINRKKVKIQATLSNPMQNVEIWFKVFDVDDPSSKSVTVDNEQAPTDNRGSWNQPAVSAMTNAQGVAEVEFEVSMQPGDNFRALASTEGVTAFTGMLAKQNDGLKARITDSNNNITQGSNSLGISGLLTVWREVHVEVDSMGVVTGNQISGQITSVTNHLVYGKNVITNQNLDDSINRFKDGNLNSDSVNYEVHSNTNGQYFKVTLKKKFDASRNEIIPSVESSFTLKDDDGISGDVPGPDTSLLEKVFAPAYVLPVFDGVGERSNNNGDVSFDLNIEEDPTEIKGQFGAGKNSPASSDDYWTVYIQSAYQGPLDRDSDPDSETNPSLGITGMFTTGNSNGSLVYIETIRDVNHSGLNHPQSWVVAHEIGHLFVGPEHLEDRNLMDQGTDVRNPVFSAIHINAIRDKNHP